jgi:hypothetical protein
MRQLEPVGAGQKPVYTEDCKEFRDFVTCYIELEGMHRFKDDREWGMLLRRFRNGTVTLEDIKKINERVVTQSTKIPNDIRYATYFNRDRDSINTGLFEERCKLLKRRDGHVNDSILIFSDCLVVRKGKDKFIKLRNCKSFWENCGEDSIRMHRGGRMDPLLKLYPGCRVMLTSNTNVREGQANGSQAIVEKVVLKCGVQARKVLISGNVRLTAVKATEVSHLVLRHCNARIEPATFRVFPRQHTVKANLLKPRALQLTGNDREKVDMKALQVPIVVNNATTGHKLQGSGVDCLFVHNWSYVTNWVYVILSRVRTQKGLFLRKPLSTNLTKYAVPEGLIKMMRKFSSKLASQWTDDEYEELFDLDNEEDEDTEAADEEDDASDND